MHLPPSLIFLSGTDFRRCSSCPDCSLGSNSVGYLHSGRGVIIRVRPHQKNRPSVAAIPQPSPPFLGSCWTRSAPSSDIGKIMRSDVPVRLSQPPVQFLCPSGRPCSHKNLLTLPRPQCCLRWSVPYVPCSLGPVSSFFLSILYSFVIILGCAYIPPDYTIFLRVFR